MRDWLWNNKEWLFSGAGISVLAIVVWAMKRLVFRGTEVVGARGDTQSLAISQAPAVNRSPVINIGIAGPKSAAFDRSDEGQNGLSNEAPARASRPDIFEIPPVVEDLPTEAFLGAADQFNRESVSAYLARFRLAADDTPGVGHELMASIDYFERVRIVHFRAPIERLVLSTAQGFWKNQGVDAITTRVGATLELIIGLMVDGRPYGIQELRGTHLPKGSTVQALPIVAASDPIARVTVLDVLYGWKWRIDYRMHQFPPALRAESKLIPIRR